MFTMKIAFSREIWQTTKILVLKNLGYMVTFKGLLKASTFVHALTHTHIKCGINLHGYVTLCNCFIVFSDGNLVFD